MSRRANFRPRIWGSAHHEVIDFDLLQSSFGVYPAPVQDDNQVRSGEEGDGEPKTQAGLAMLAYSRRAFLFGVWSASFSLTKTSASSSAMAGVDEAQGATPRFEPALLKPTQRR
jgi:hypothetical protein